MKTFSALLIVTLTFLPGVLAQTLRERKSINELTPTEIGDYIHALDKLRQRSAIDESDVAGYTYWADLHNDMFVGPCEHGSDAFLAWHRAHLYYFENLLRKSDPPRTANVTIPYWDFVHPQENGVKFPPALLLPGLSMPRSPDDANLPLEAVDIVKTLAWPEFGGYPEGSPDGDYGDLELGPHNYMHGTFIRGLMGSAATAAEDPIYWSFHCFIDLLWAEWQQRHPTEPATSPDHDLRGFDAFPMHKIRDFQSTVTLGYAYKYTTELSSTFPPPPPFIAAAPVLLAAQTLSKIEAEPLKDCIRGNSCVNFSFPAAIPPAKRFLLRINGLTVPTAGSYTVRVYLHPASEKFSWQDEAYAKQYLAQSVTLWRAHEHPKGSGHEGHSHHPPAATARVDVTKLMTKLKADGHANLVVTLHYVPSGEPSGSTRLPEKLIQQLELKDVLLQPIN